MGSKSIKKKAVVSDGRKTHQGSRKPLPRKAKQKQAIPAITKEVQDCSKKQIPRITKQKNGNAVLCDACHAIFDGSGVEIYDDRPGKFRLHHLTRDSMQAAIEAGCELCRILWDSYQEGFVSFMSWPRNSNSHQTFSSYWLPTTGGKDPVDTDLDFEINNVDDGNHRLAVCSKNDMKPKSMSIAFVRFALYPTNGASRTFHNRGNSSLIVRSYVVDRADTQNCGSRNYGRQTSLGEPSTSVEGSLFQIAGWLRHCDEKHSCTSIPFSMPSRVLDINHPDGADYLRVDFSPPIAPYATLSHCWGPVEERKPPELTSANWDTLTKRISIASLPRTFQEAILMVKNIGVRYLWIDSLCIIQDSKSDWQKESGRMTEIYRNTFVNIAAEAAPDCHAGLFVRRDDECVRVYALTGVGIASSPSQNYLLVPRKYREMNEDNPLRKRAWTFQERLLAPRQISFGRRQVMWKCSRLAACEVFPSGYPCSSMEEHIDSKFLQYLESDHSMEDASGDLWHRLVQAYTMGALTREEDKLVAIQGVVKLLKPMLKDDYLAGLWRNSLASDLLWRYPVTHPGSGYRPGKYRAPTWSWASVEGQIAWPAEVPHAIVSSESMIKILNVRMTPEGSDQPGQATDYTGQIKMGHIYLRGRLRSTKGGKFDGTGLKNLFSYAEDDGNYLVHIDDVTQWIDEKHFLLIRWQSFLGSGPTRQISGLVLTRDTRRLTTFRRVGMFWDFFMPDNHKWLTDFMAQEEQTITLI
jgi:hypothetical protein